MKKTINKILRFIATIVLCVISAIGGQVKLSALPVFAATKNSIKFDENYVMDDLNGATINGKTFNIEDYSFDEKRNTGIVLFTEYCYSFYANKQENFGLYVYVWNPKGLIFDTDSPLNKLQFSFGDRAHYNKYSLLFLSKCEEVNYEGLFYKFKVDLTESERSAILNTVDSAKRFYHVSGIELKEANKTNATETVINLEYIFSGYAEGYGAGNNPENTLVCNTEQGEVLSLDVHSTYYRPNGASGGDIHTQDTLHSVYFSVPNALIDEYGKMTAVHATWLNALTRPVLVTGNKSLYDVWRQHIGEDIGKGTDDFLNAFVANFFSDSLASHFNTNTYKGDYYYNWKDFGVNNSSADGKLLSRLDYIFYAENGNADDYTLPAETLLNWLVTYTQEHGGELVSGKYSKALFSSVDDEFTDINIRADKTFSLTSEKISRSWWDKLWNKNGTVESTTTYDNIEAIKAVTESDMTGTETDICDSLYVDRSDYTEFKNVYDNALKSNETVYLFRYYTSTYYSAEATTFTMPKSGTFSEAYGTAKEIDTNAYVMTEWLQLDFDIIDVTFTNGGVDTVIPVVSSPQDIASDGTSPIETTDDFDWKKILQIIFGALLLILLLVILMPILPTIISAIIKIILLPFRLIASIFKAIFHKKE